MFWGKERGQLASRALAGCKYHPAEKSLLTSPLAKNQSVAKVFTQDYHVEAEKSENHLSTCCLLPS